MKHLESEKNCRGFCWRYQGAAGITHFTRLYSVGVRGLIASRFSAVVLMLVSNKRSKMLRKCCIRPFQCLYFLCTIDSNACLGPKESCLTSLQFADLLPMRSIWGAYSYAVGYLVLPCAKQKVHFSDRCKHLFRHKAWTTIFGIIAYFVVSLAGFEIPESVLE